MSCTQLFNAMESPVSVTIDVLFAKNGGSPRSSNYVLLHFPNLKTFNFFV